MTEAQLMRAYATGQISKQQYNDEMTKLVGQNAGGMIPGGGMTMGSVQKAGGLLAVNGALEELIQMLKSGKQLDPHLLKMALKEITRLAGKPLGQKNLQGAIGYEAQASPSISTLQQSIGRFGSPQELGFATGARSAESAAGGVGQGLAGLGGKLPPPPANTGNALSAVGNVLRGSGTPMQVAGKSPVPGFFPELADTMKQGWNAAPRAGKIAAGATAAGGGLAALYSMFSGGESKPQLENFDAGWESPQLETLRPGAKATKRPSMKTGANRPRRPGISELAPKTESGIPEDLGDKFSSAPEALQFLTSRDPTDGISMFEGQTSNQGVLADTTGQHTLKSKTNKNLIKSILKGLW